MKTEKIKFWARLGEIAFWISQFLSVRREMEYVPFETAGTMAQILAFAWFVFALIFSEAIVRLIIYFSELLEKEN